MVVLIPASNSGGKTYDGIDVCAERAVQEIESFVNMQSQRGREITRFSVVGYSLGGLIARYVVAMLLEKGWFGRMMPVNYTAFACPQLGVRSPYHGPISWMYNNTVSTISVTGVQLCGIDDFRGTGRSLLSVMADPRRNFIRALSLFENRSLYSNIANDRFSVHYTSTITQQRDPYVDLKGLNINYLDGYSNVLLDPAKPFTLIENRRQWNFPQWISRGAFVVLFAIWGVVVVVPAFVVYSAVQNVRSKRRLHLLKQKGVLGHYHNILPAEDALAGGIESRSSAKRSNREIANEQPADITLSTGVEARLNLTDDQMSMIKALNDVGFQNRLVHIKKTIFSHSAIIVRRDSEMFSEGRAVIDYWLEHDFEI
jgi:hypothetical protein